VKDDGITKGLIMDAVLYVQLWCKEWEDCTATRLAGKQPCCKCYHELRTGVSGARRVSDDRQSSEAIGFLDRSFWENQYTDPEDGA
jgi:hypothetical protein